MKSMTMAFGTGPDVDRKMLSAGAKIELVLEIGCEREPALLIKKASPLPADTVLKL